VKVVTKEQVEALWEDLCAAMDKMGVAEENRLGFLVGFACAKIARDNWEREELPKIREDLHAIVDASFVGGTVVSESSEAN